jgi:hypothetical protein
MKERPILFSAPMVRALLAGTKTVTRRAVKSAPVHVTPFIGRDDLPTHEFGLHLHTDRVIEKHVRCPYGEPGDRLWVRETWQYADWTEDGHPYIRCAADDSRRLCERVPSEWSERLSSVWSELSAPENFAIDGRAADRCWRPSIFMPRWASRITLEVVSVRVERLHEITEEDARSEGVEPTIYERKVYPSKHAATVERRSYRDGFELLWIAINGSQSWAANPFVWRVEFRRIQPESIATPISRSSIGAALRDIEERGIDAHLADLERQL